MVPFKKALKSEPGLDALSYLLSFGIGAAIMTPIILSLYYFASSSSSQRRLFVASQWRDAMKPGLLTGLLWSGGNFCR